MNQMKALSVWQPWASLLPATLNGARVKQFETRGWATRYRGPIAIHAAAKSPRWVVAHDYDGLPAATLAAMGKALGIFPGDFGDRMFDKLPRGAIIATAELVECWEITGNDGRGEAYIHLDAETARDGRARFRIVHGYEYRFGDWSPGRYAWQLEDMKLLPTPIPAKGAQGLWWWDERFMGIDLASGPDYSVLSDGSIRQNPNWRGSVD